MKQRKLKTNELPKSGIPLKGSRKRPGMRALRAAGRGYSELIY